MDLNRMQQLAGIIPTRSGLAESPQVGKTILQQMGGAGRIQAMLGAKNIILLDNGVSFRWPNKERSKGNAVRITLDPSDTYTMEFLNVSGSSAKSVKKYTDVYNDQLVDIFEKQTGWFLSLGGGKKSSSGTKPGPEVDPSNVTAKQVGATKAPGDTFWTVSSIDGTFPTLDAAKKAWFTAGKPKGHGNSVWATEHRGVKTLQTITLNPSMEAKLDELRALLGEKKPVEDKKDCYCKDGDDCDCTDEGDSAEEEREFSQDQLDAMEAVQGYKLPFYARTKTSDGEQWFKATGTLKNGNFSGMMLDAGAAGRSSSKAKKSSLDAKWAKQSWDEVDADKVPPKIKSALGEDVEDCGCEDPMDALLDSVRDIVEGKTYKQAQADIMTGLEKEGWKVNRTLKVPHATSPHGDFKLFFKSQAIYKTHGKGDLGNARSLHLPDIRAMDFDGFASHLKRWTGRELNDQPLQKKPAAAPSAAKPAAAPAAAAAEPAHQLTPDQYHAKHGQCPDGYNFDDSSKRCVKAKNESLVEMHRLAGINPYPDRALVKGPVPRTMTGMVSEIRKYATGSLHPDWVVAEEPLAENKGFQCMECGKKFKSVKAAENAQQNGCPKCGGTDIDLAEHAEDRTDLWHPDKDVKNPGLPMDKPKAAAPVDKGHALLKALKCPPGKEPKLVYGKPSCAPVAKA